MTMLPIPQIQIHQQFARVGIETQSANLEIRQPRPEMNMQTTPSKLDIQSPGGDLQIDSSAAWDALGVGSNRDWLNQIYSQAKQVALQGIARIAEDGDRMADLTIKSDPIPELAARAFDPVEFEYRTEAALDNVHSTYTAHQPIINNQAGYLDIQVQTHPPDIQYDPGKINLYLLQKNSIEITPPVIDLQV